MAAPRTVTLTVMTDLGTVDSASHQDAKGQEAQATLIHETYPAHRATTVTLARARHPSDTLLESLNSGDNVHIEDFPQTT